MNVSAVTGLPLEVRFLKLLARRLHEYGTAAHRLERAVGAAAEELGIECEVFSSPTSLLLSFRYPDDHEEQRLIPTQLIRLRPGDIDLAKLAIVDDIGERMRAGEIDVQQAMGELRLMPNLGMVMPSSVHALSFGVVGATVAALLAGTWTDILAATALGMVTALFVIRFGERLREAGSMEAVAAFVVTLLAYGAAVALPEVTVGNVIIGALIILMPGLGLTIAITELSTEHLASGTARFAGAAVILVKLALGVMLATQLALQLGYQPDNEIDAALRSPGWFLWLSLLLSGFAFAVLFNARYADYLPVIAAAVLSFVVQYSVSDRMGGEIGVFTAALAIGLMSNGFARFTNRPATIMRLPGIILLVPGSIGYRALNFLFSRNVADGLDALISVALVLGSLVGGLLIGNSLLPPRRNL